MKTQLPLRAIIALCTFVLPLFLRSADAQSLPEAYRQRVAILTVNGSDTQLGLVVGERGNKLYVVTVRNENVAQYPPVRVALGRSSISAEARWYKDDKAISAAKLMLLSVPKPADYILPSVHYYTHPNEGQTISIPTENNSRQYTLRIVSGSPSKLILSPISRFNPSNDYSLNGAPLYLQDRGIVGLLYSPQATNIQAYSIGGVRDAIQADDENLFNLQPYNKDDEVVISNKPTDTHVEMTPVNEPISQPAEDNGDTPKQPTVSEKPDKRPLFSIGLDFAYYSIGKPSEPAFTPQKEPLSGHVGLGFNFSPINRLTLHISPRYNARTAYFAKDAKYANYMLTYIQMQSVELAAGLEINLSPNLNTFFIHLGGSVCKPIKADYSYTLQNLNYTTTLRDDQKTWQKGAIGGIGLRTGSLRFLASYYYGLDPYIDDNELSNTSPKVTPFKQQRTTFQYLTIGAGFYF